MKGKEIDNVFVIKVFPQAQKYFHHITINAGTIAVTANHGINAVVLSILDVHEGLIILQRI